MYPRTGDRDEEAFRRDERVVLAAQVMDPTLGGVVLSPELSPARIIELAERSPTRRWTLRPGRPASGVALAFVVIVVVASLAIPAVLVRKSPGVLSEALESAPASFYLGDGTSSPAGPQLRSMAASAGTSNAPGLGAVTYTRVQTWSLETTSGTPTATTFDEQLWWTADGAGRKVVTKLAQWFSYADARAGVTRAVVPPSTTTYLPGELAIVVPQPSDDPALLAAQLDEHEPLVNGPQAVLRGVRDLYRYHALDGPTRNAALRLLAETPNIIFRGQVSLEPGRRGAVFSADSQEGAVRDLAVFDATDGSLLAYQQVSTRQPGSTTRVAPYVTFTMIVVANGRTDTIGALGVHVG